MAVPVPQTQERTVDGAVTQEQVSECIAEQIVGVLVTLIREGAHP